MIACPQIICPMSSNFQTVYEHLFFRRKTKEEPIFSEKQAILKLLARVR
jgi:hypothetical protein